MSLRLMSGVVALAVAGSVLVPSSAHAQECVEQTVTLGIVKAEGCFVQSGGRYTTTEKLRLNGFDVTVHSGVTVSLSKDSVTTNNGFVDLAATHPKFGTVHFNNMNFAFSPPVKGELVLSDSALAQPYMSLLGLTPIGVKQPITLTDGKAKFDLSFNLGGLFTSLIAKTDKQLAFGVGIEVEDGKYKIASGKFGVSEFELAELIKVNDLAIEFEPPDDLSVEFDGGLKPMSGFTVIGGVGYGAGPAIKFARLGIGDLNKPLGSSGIYLQKLAVTLFPSPPYGGSGQVTMSVGPKVKFLGKEVTAVEADGKIELRAADVPKKKPAYFTTSGNFRLMTLPIANAGFTYWFGQGTAFNASVGIGLPSGTNDPGQPTYIGGGFSGWTTAKNFDLEGNARLKLLGIDLLGAKTVISDYGMAGCLQVGLWLGGGVRWSDGRGEMLGGFTCDVGAYQRQARAMADAGDGKTRLSLDEDESIVRIAGVEDSSQVVLTAGDREIASPAPGDSDGIQKDDDGTSFTTDDSTVFVLDKPAGDWTVRSDGGLGSIETASPLPAHKVRAKISGKGKWRTLTWSARDIPYQKLHFSEVVPGAGEIPILTTGKASGTYRFKPVQGSWGRQRKLAVDVTQRFNTPRDSLVADVYRVRRQPAPEAITGLRVQRLTDDVVARWRPVAGAKSYRVDATPLASGVTFRKVVSGTRARLTMGTTDQLRVRVRPVTSQGRIGPGRAQLLDTEGIVANVQKAASQAARRAAETGPRRIATLVECPEGTHCSVRVDVRRGGELIGRSRAVIPPDMADRVVVRSSKPVSGAKVTVRVEQAGEVGVG